MKHANYKKSTRIADEIVGYSFISVDDSTEFTLADGVDDASASVPIPGQATGCIIVCAITDGDQMRISVNGGRPDITDKHGYLVDVNNVEIHLGKTSLSDGSRSEMDNFKAICETGKTATLSVTYVQFNG